MVGRSIPHALDRPRDVDSRQRRPRRPALAAPGTHGHVFEMQQDAVGQEAAARCAYMPVAVAGLAGDVEALGLEQVEAVAGAGHGDVEQPPPSSTFSGRSVAMSEGMQPSTRFSTNTAFHSWPLAEWMVDRIR